MWPFVKVWIKYHLSLGETRSAARPCWLPLPASHGLAVFILVCQSHALKCLLGHSQFAASQTPVQVKHACSTLHHGSAVAMAVRTSQVAVQVPSFGKPMWRAPYPFPRPQSVVLYQHPDDGNDPNKQAEILPDVYGSSILQMTFLYERALVA